MVVFMCVDAVSTSDVADALAVAVAPLLSLVMIILIYLRCRKISDDA